MLLIFWPFLDRGKERHPRKRPIAVSVGLFAVVSAVFLGYLGHVSDSEQTYFGKRYFIDLLGRPHLVTDGAPHGVSHEDASHAE